MRYWQLAIVFTLTILASLARVDTAYACSGRTATLEESMAESPIIVRAQVLESDDHHQNSIVQVETYFKGSGPEYMLIAGNTRGLSNGLIEGRYGMGDCMGFYAAMRPGTTMYMFLQESYPGTYRYYSRIFGFYDFHFPTPEATVQVFLNDAPDYVDITENQFLTILDEVVTDEPQLPLESIYPIPSLLRITTTSGAEYVLPPDGSAPIELTPEMYLWLHNRYLDLLMNESIYDLCAGNLDCFQFAPNYVDMAVHTENTILMSNGDEIPGQSFLFSPTSDTIAVWNNNMLELHILPYRDLFDFNWRDPYKIINAVELEMVDIASAEHAAWSPDGRMLAYSDAAGLWLWDVFTVASAPRLLLPAEGHNLPLARHFSPLGRYLAIQNGDTFEHIDLVSLQRLPDGMFSPDERLFLDYETTAEISEVSYCLRAVLTCWEIESRVREIIWMNNETYLAYWCGVEAEDKDYCRLVVESDHPSGYYGEPDAPITDIAYQADSGLLAVAYGDYTLEIERWQTFDLSDVLPDPIAAIEWLPSLFYFDN